jgi:hypothetical protein
MNARRSFLKLQRSLSLAAAVAFCFFLIASAPHRVHHFFEQLPGSSEHQGAHAAAHEHTGAAHNGHDHHDRDHERTPQQPDDCVVLSVAQNAHASLVHSFNLWIFDSAVTRRRESGVVAASSFNPAPRSQRAPPLA